MNSGKKRGAVKSGNKILSTNDSVETDLTNGPSREASSRSVVVTDLTKNGPSREASSRSVVVTDLTTNGPSREASSRSVT